ncbi:MAG: 30S ribosomal protein S4 [Pseudomonadota bacterium]|nr:30S ribosomal protein S4 [Pseudomonadota bacterium]
MAKYQKPKAKLLRAVRTSIEGESDLDLFSGIRPIAKKCKLDKLPGRADVRRGKGSEYGILVGTKQAMKRYYGILEKQFKITYLEAARRKGSTGDNLLTLLESRLDNVVFRSGFASTRAEARQLVSHGHIKVDGKKVSIASFRVSQGQVVSLSDAAKKHLRVLAALELAKQRPELTWLTISTEDMSATVATSPNIDTLHGMFKVNNVVELYSK